MRFRALFPLTAAFFAMAAAPALAGTLELSPGAHVDYIADANEENVVTLGFRSAFDFSTGQVVQGYIVQDSAGITPGAGCRLVTPQDDDVAICDVFTSPSVFVQLKDENDRAEVLEGFTDPGGPVGSYLLEGGLGNDTLIGGSRRDVLLGNEGVDDLEGRDGDDHLNGGTNNDTVLGGFGNDTVLGYLGDDSVRGNSGDDAVDGGGGADSVRGDSDTDELEGGPGPDLVFSRDGNAEPVHCGLGTDRFDSDSDDDRTSCEIRLDP